MVMKIQFKQWWSTILPISMTVTTTCTSHYKSLNTKEDHSIGDDGNLGPGLESDTKL